MTDVSCLVVLWSPLSPPWCFLCTRSHWQRHCQLTQPRRARSRSKADVENLRAAKEVHPNHPHWVGQHCRCFPGRAVHMCVGACTYVSMCTLVHVEARGQANCHSSGTLVFYCLRQSLSLAWGPRLGWSGWPASPRDPPVCPSPVLTL